MARRLTDRSAPPDTAAATTALRLRLQGVAQVERADGQRIVLEPRAAAVLALAALEPGVPRERVARWLWPDSADPRRNLRQQLLRFRQQFDHPLVEGDPLLSLAEGVRVDDDGRQTLLGDLADVGSEDFAAWLRARNDARQTHAIESVRDALARAEQANDLDGALREAERWCLQAPASESAHRALMRVHYLRNDAAAGLSVHERLRQRLHDEHATALSPETEALAQALRASRPRLAMTPPAPTAPAAIPVTLLRPPRLVGRDRELAAWQAAWGRQDAVLLHGEPGIGKSRLIQEFGHGHRLAVAAGRPGDRGVPYATLARLLRPLAMHAAAAIEPHERQGLALVLPEWAPGATLPPDAQRLALQRGTQAVCTRLGLTGIAIDDLHFADDASIECLLAMASDPAVPLRWLFAQRPGEGSAAAVDLRAALEEAARLSLVDLQPLDLEAMHEFVAQLALPGLNVDAIAPALWRHSGGNPLFALETLKQGLGDGSLGAGRLPRPGSVGALIERRLAGLGDRALALARVAAIAGIDFDVTLASTVIGVPAVDLANAWGDLEAAQILRDGAFAHDLVHDAVLRSIPSAIAQHLHGQVAQWLADRGGEPARRAAHWQAAGNRRRAGEDWIEAGHAADRQQRFRESMQCFEAAAAQFLALDDRAGCHRALLGAVDQASLLDLPVDAYVDLVERLVASAPDGAAMAKARVYRMRTLEMTGQSDRLLEEGCDVIALAQAEGLKETEAVALVACGTGRLGRGLFDAALADFRRVAELGAALGDGELEGMGHSSAATVLVRAGRSREALREFDVAHEIYVRHRRPMRVALVAQQRSMVHLGHGQATLALEAADAALRGLIESDASFDMVAHGWLARAMALSRLGRFAEAVALLLPLTESGERPDHWVSDRLHLELAQTFVHLGRVDLGVRHLAQARAADRLPLAERQRAHYVELQLRLLGHDAARPLPDLPPPDGEPRRRCELLRVRAALVPTDDRAALLDEALSLASRFDLVDERCTAQAALALHLLDAGQVQAARELVRVALQDPAVVPAGYPPAAAAHAHAVLVGSGEFEAARQLRDETLAWINRAASALAPEFRTSFLERHPVNRTWSSTSKAAPA